MNEENLIPNKNRTPDERRELAQKAGIASGEARREQRKLKELIDIAMAKELKNKETGESATRKEITAIQLANKCVNGDLKAIKLVAQLTGELVTKSEVTGKDGKELFAGLTDEQLEERVKELQRKMNE